MYFIPIALLIKALDPGFTISTGADVTRLTGESFLADNLLPVTLGNVIGGTLLVAAVYWFVYLRNAQPVPEAPAGQQCAAMGSMSPDGSPAPTVPHGRT